MNDEPTVVWMPGSVRTEVHLTAADTNRAFCLLLDEPPAGWSLPAHRHLNESETIHVLEGEFEIELEGVRTRLAAGQTIHVPRGAVHAGGNVGAGRGRRIVIFSPAGLERFFLEAGSAEPQEEVDWGAVGALAVQHGWDVLSASR